MGIHGAMERLTSLDFGQGGLINPTSLAAPALALLTSRFNVPMW